MNPNSNYDQVVCGPGQTSRSGRSPGVKCMARVVKAVWAPGWASAIDFGLVNWTMLYIKWLTRSQVELAVVVA